MKRSDIDFTIPSRQSFAAIFLIILKTYRIIIRQAWPFLLILLFQGGESNKYTRYLSVIVGIVAVIGMLFSIIDFFRFYYYTENQDLIINKGIFSRKKLIIPFDRVQAVNLEENIVHRLLNVVGLKIDTAGSSKSALKLDAISRTKAIALKRLLLSHREYEKGLRMIDQITDEEESGTVILQLDMGDLFRIGLTQNHIRSGGFIFLFFFWVYQNLRDAGIEMDQYEEGVLNVQYTLSSIMTIVILLLIIALLISLVRTIIRYYHLRFTREGGGFTISSGLFTRKDMAARDRKIQMIAWSDNLLKKIIGLHDLSIKQASSIAIEAKKSLSVPGLTRQHIQSIETMLYGRPVSESIAVQQVEEAFRNRRILYATLFCLGLAVVFWFLQNSNMVLLSAALWLYFLVATLLRYKKLRWGTDDDYLYIRGGAFGDKETVLPIYKIQAIEKVRTPYQRRNGLTDLIIHTAAGAVRLPYIKLSTGHQVMDKCMYQVESSRKRWM